MFMIVIELSTVLVSVSDLIVFFLSKHETPDQYKYMSLTWKKLR